MEKRCFRLGLMINFNQKEKKIPDEFKKMKPILNPNETKTNIIIDK